MTKELLQEQLEILDRTNMHKNAAKERVIPESYLAYKNQVEQKETMLESPSTGVPVRCVITKANNLEKDAPLFINLHGGGFVHPQDGDDDLFCAGGSRNRWNCSGCRLCGNTGICISNGV